MHRLFGYGMRLVEFERHAPIKYLTVRSIRQHRGKLLMMKEPERHYIINRLERLRSLPRPWRQTLSMPLNRILTMFSVGREGCGDMDGEKTPLPSHVHCTLLAIEMLTRSLLPCRSNVHDNEASLPTCCKNSLVEADNL
jgi:hypothetical protein